MQQADSHNTPRAPSARRDFTIDPERDHFDALFAEWLTVRANYSKLPDSASDRVAGEEQRLSKRETELARLITTLPASQPWMILSKLEVLRHYLACEGGTAWGDNREIVMLAGIEADLLRFPPGHADG